MERKYICIKSPFFISTHTAEVLEKDKTCILYSGMCYVNLALTCASGIFPHDQRWIALCTRLRKQVWFWTNWRRRWRVFRTLFPFLLPSHLSSLRLLCPSIQGTLSHYSHHLYLLPNNLFSVWIIFLGTSFTCNGSSDTR